MRIRCLSILALSFVSALAAASSGWWRVHVHVPDEAALQRLLDSGLRLMQCHPRCGETHVLLGPGDEFRLRLLGLSFTYEREMDPPDAWAKSQVRRTSADTSIQSEDYRNRYFNADEILAFYENLRAAYPLFVSRVQIGTSINNEPMWAYRIGRPLRTGSEPENNIVFLHLIHAREWISGSVGMHIAKRAAETIATPQTSPFMVNQALWIVAITNPDGYRFSWTNDRYWRKNRRRNSGGSFGVDLNRNFATGWGGGGSSGNQSSEVYRGTAPFSEPESQAVRNLALSLGRVGAFIDFHNYSQLVLWPWGYTTTRPPGWQTFDQQGERLRVEFSKFGATYAQGQCSRVLYQASGITSDWFFDQFGTPAYTVELRDTGNFGFELPPSQIRPSQDEAWAGALQLIRETPR